MMVSDMCYAGKTLAEIAGYSTIQMNHMLFLKRDKWGRLEDPRNALPPGVEVDDNGMRVISPNNRRPFTKSFQRVKKRQGLNDAEAQKAWDDYLARHPSLVDLIERNKRVRQRKQQRSTQPTGA